MSHPFRELSDTALDALIARERERALRLAAPLTDWSALSAQLREEGVLRSAGSPLEQGIREEGHPSFDAPPARARWSTWGARLMVGAALVGVGVVVGRGMAGGPTSSDTPATLAGPLASAPEHAVLAHAEGGDSVRVSVAAPTQGFMSPDAAWEALARSQGEYQRAAAYLVAHGDTVAPDVPDIAAPRLQNRLAALDEMATVTRKALDDAPQDPLLSQYYLMTIGAREATREQFNRVLPAGARLATF